MGFHHVSLATKDFAATHRFYTELMGFELAKVTTAATPTGGWAKLLWYDTGGGGMMTFWDLHDEAIGAGYKTDLSGALGLPVWVNHLAFDAPTPADLESRKQIWREHGITVVQMDFGNAVSIYATDPNGILVEFSCTLRPFTAQDRVQAQHDLVAERPEFETRPARQIFAPLTSSAWGAYPRSVAAPP